jgi:hypothetical protein
MLSDQEINNILTTMQEIKEIIKDTNMHGLYDEYKDIWQKKYMGIEYSKIIEKINDIIDVFLDTDKELLKTITYTSSLYEKYLKTCPNFMKQQITTILHNPAQAKQVKSYGFDNKTYSTDAFGFLNVLYHALNLIVIHFALDLRTKTRFPGYNRKLQQLKELINEIENQKNNLYEAESIYEQILNIANKIDESQQSLEEIKKIESTSKELLKSTQKLLTETEETINELQEKAKNLLKEIETYASESKVNNEEISRIKGQIKNFFDDIEAHKEQIEKTKQEVKETIKQFKTETNEIIEENKKLQENIHELLKKAIAGSLFKAFENRKNELQWPLYIWLIILMSLIGIAYFVAAGIFEDIKNIKDISPMFLILKITLLAPIAYGIYFASKKYSQERHLAEEYAFKSTVSVSMNAFNDVLKKYQDKKISEKQLELMIKTINNLFESPTDKVFKREPISKENKKLFQELINFFKLRNKNQTMDEK